LTDFFTDFFLAPFFAPFLLDFLPDFFFVAMRHLQVSPRRVDLYRTFAALFAAFDITRTTGAGA
jgi:hypothetical protein